MKKVVGVYLVVLVLLFSASLVIAAPKVTNTCPIKSTTDIVIYGQTGLGGVGTPSKSWMTHFMNWLVSNNPGLEYVFVDAADVSNDCTLTNFPNVKLYVQPGGDAYYQQRSLGASGKNKIISYINNGGKYLGTCAGWYYASGDYYWQDSYYAHSNLLGLFPTIEGSIKSIADYDSSSPYALTTLSNGFNAIYYGGPTQGMKDTSINLPTNGQVLTYYSGSLSSLPAIVKTENMLLTSVHLEAYENDGITGLTTEQRIENYKLLGNMINDLTGLNLVIPSYALPKQCNDGLDNDGDNLIDMADAGCSSLSDDNEIDGAGPVDLLVDGFEDGNLDGWIVSGSGNLWSVSSLNPKTGSYHAQANQPGAGSPTYMERAVSTSGKSDIVFEYSRKLIGLDSVDYFYAQWYDGSSWTTLEQAKSVTDSSYVSKSYILPSSASNNPNFKIRFSCEAGAISEYCRIDDVRVYSQ